MREDYVAEIDPYASILPEKFRNRFRLERMLEQSALSCVQEPLKGTTRRFAPKVAEALVDPPFPSEPTTITVAAARIATINTTTHARARLEPSEFITPASSLSPAAIGASPTRIRRVSGRYR